jgi:hypothetical protein
MVKYNVTGILYCEFIELFLKILYSRGSFTGNVWGLAHSGLTVFPEFRYLSTRAQWVKKDILSCKVW